MGSTYYVSASEGNNNNPGNQAANPLRTIQAAINKSQAGDTIVVRNGTYAERLHIQKPGTADAPIAITAQQGEAPVIDGTHLNIPRDTALVVIQQSQNINFSGLTIRNSGGIGLMVHKSSRVALAGVTAESSYAGGIHIIQSDTVAVEKCHIHDCGRRFLAHGPERHNVALLTRNSKNVTIQDNQICENSDEGIAVSVGSRNIVVRKNVCYDNRNGQISVTSAINVVIDSNLCYHTGREQFLTLEGTRAPGIVKSDLWRYRLSGAWHARHIKVVNNIVVGCGVGFSATRPKGRLTNVQVAHNTILNSASQAFDVRMREKSVRSYIENNLVASPGDEELVRTVGGAGIVWRHNLWSSFPGERVYNPSSDVIDPEVGLATAHAPLAAGQVSADAYKLVSGSPAINRGVPLNGETTTDFWGQRRDSQPDIGAYEYPGSNSQDPGTGPDLPANGNRISKGLVALYEFKEGQGREVRDVSGAGSPLNLRITQESKVVWTADGLMLKEPVLITSEKPATKIIDACRVSNEITLEAWIRPANVTQDGPARIISISSSKTQRNATLGQGLHGNQPPDLYMVRLRTSQTSTNGLPAVVSPSGSATNALTHVVYTRASSGRATLYINGQDRGVLDVGGDLSNWDDRMPLLLGDELSEDRPWLGLLHLCAVYSRALEPGEVLHNYESGFQSDTSLTADFSILPEDEMGIAPHIVEFDSSSSFSSTPITTYFWEFGDGQTATLANPAHTYTAPGVYTVSLTVTDAEGQTDKIIKEQLITVVDKPVAPLPAEYARFALVDVATSRVVAFGIQYPDSRCALMWNEEPYHMVVFTEIDDIRVAYVLDTTVEIVWVDGLEEI